MQEILRVKKNNGLIYLGISMILFGLFFWSAYLSIKAIIVRDFPFYYAVMLMASLASAVLFLVPAINILILKNPVIVIQDEKLILYPNNRKREEFSLLSIKVEVVKNPESAKEVNTLVIINGDKIYKIHNGIDILEAKKNIDFLILRAKS